MKHVFFGPYATIKNSAMLVGYASYRDDSRGHGGDDDDDE